MHKANIRGMRQVMLGDQRCSARCPTQSQKKKGVRRKVSKATRDLHTSTETKTKRVKKKHDDLKEARRKTGLTDFKTWVNECADLLNHANGHGDTKTAHDLIKQMEGKSDKPPKNL